MIRKQFVVSKGKLWAHYQPELVFQSSMNQFHSDSSNEAHPIYDEQRQIKVNNERTSSDSNTIHV
jgi:hypothetical protein